MFKLLPAFHSFSPRRMILAKVFRGIRPFSRARELCASDVYEKIRSCAVDITTTSLDNKGDTHVVYGAGTIWDSSGIIVTCFHVIQTALLERAGKISVSVSHDDSTWYVPGVVITRQYDAHIVNGDPIDDIAVLRIKDPEFNLKPIKFEKLSNSPIGVDVYSIGNPFGLDHSFNHGIISGHYRALRRKNGIDMKNAIQTDCPMQKGSSGGPLFDNKGRCIGINACGFSLTCSFSIPAFWVRYRVSHLMNVEGPLFAPRRSTGHSYAHRKAPFGPEESLATDYTFEVTDVGAGCSTSAAWVQGSEWSSGHACKTGHLRV